jgi:hypothetical protein
MHKFYLTLIFLTLTIGACKDKDALRFDTEFEIMVTGTGCCTNAYSVQFNNNLEELAKITGDSNAKNYYAFKLPQKFQNPGLVLKVKIKKYEEQDGKESICNPACLQINYPPVTIIEVRE